MVHIFKHGKAKAEVQLIGEIVFEDEKYFRIHSSDIIFNKSEYRYERVP